MAFNLPGRLKGRAFAFGAVFLMSLAPILIKLGILQSLDAIPLLTLRFWLAALVLWPVFFIVDRRVLRVRRKQLLPLFLASAIFAASYLLYYLALPYIGASIDHMLVAVSPAVVLLLLFIDGRRAGPSSLARLALVFVGLYLLIAPTGSLSLVGVLLGLGGTVTYGGFLFFVEKWLPEVPSMTVTLYVDTIVALLLGGVYLLQYGGWVPVSPSGWWIIAITGLFSTALGHFFFVSSVKTIGSGETALINPFETVFTVLLAILFLGESLNSTQWLGGALILASAFLIGRQLALPRSPTV
ncbi:MAG TPA: DMT family transporter [Anaerolineales bacterium]|nr:DMT family transporter [Anaerolineales bacterium]